MGLHINGVVQWMRHRAGSCRPRHGRSLLERVVWLVQVQHAGLYRLLLLWRQVWCVPGCSMRRSM